MRAGSKPVPNTYFANILREPRNTKYIKKCFCSFLSTHIRLELHCLIFSSAAGPVSINYSLPLSTKLP